MSLLPRRSALVLSTTPPIPRDYGNRNRVYQTLSFLKSLGYGISFILYPFDKDWAESVPDYYKELVAQFDYFAVIPNSRKLHQLAEGEFHEIDEWWDETIAAQLTWLFARKNFDIVFVNYTFLSKAFELAPKGALRILDTHDIFSGRREMFEANGVKPEFFYTTKEREASAYARAHAVLAIKDSEAKYIQGLNTGKTLCLPYFDDRAVLDVQRKPRPAFTPERPLRLGFIGAENSVNIVNIQRFLEIFRRYVLLYNPPLEMLVAGDVCKGLRTDYPFLHKLGRVASVESFYDAVDAVIVPFAFSTGIKIKVGEALARRVPVLATQNGFDGYRGYHPSQTEADLHALSDRLVGVAFGEVPFRDLDYAGLKSARAGLRAQQRGFDQIRGWLLASSRRLLVVVDRPFWYRACFIDECIAQAVEFLSHTSQVILCCVAAETPNMRGVYAKVGCVTLPAAGVGMAGLATELSEQYQLRGVVLLLAGDATQRACREAFADTPCKQWSLEMVADGVNTQLAFSERAGGTTIPVSALKYLPMGAAPRTAPELEIVLFWPQGSSAWQRLAGRHVHLVAGEAGYAVRDVVVPPYHEYSGAFFTAATREVPSLALALADDVFWTAMLEDFYNQMSTRLMIIHPDFLAPECRTGDGFSLEGSIRQFISGHAALSPAVGDAGWSAVWDVMVGE